MLQNTQFHHWKVEFLLHLRDFVNQLQKHFDLEKDSLFMEEKIQLAPYYKPTLDRFLKTDQDLLQGLENIIADLKRARADDALKAHHIPEPLFTL